MEKLAELKQAYERLGKEIEALEQKELEQDKVQVKGHIFYPIFCRHIITGFVVKFTGFKSGVVVTSKIGGYELNHTSNSWIPHTQNNIWEQIAICPKTGFYDKQPVWCWDDADVCRRALRFYDAKNSKTFHFEGSRAGLFYKNYAPYEGEWMPWMIEAFDKLKD